MKSIPTSAQSGFSLVELAIVMLVIAFLVSGAILPLSTSIDRSRIRDAQSELDNRIRGALLGYAASRPLGSVFFPCPDCTTAACPGPGNTSNDGVEDRDPAAVPPNTCSVVVGNLPWVTLGAAPVDPWGSRYGYGVSREFTDPNGFDLVNPDLTPAAIGAFVQDGNGNQVVGDGADGGQENVPIIVWSFGKNRLGAVSQQGVQQAAPPAGTDEFENADNDQLFITRPLDLDGNVEQFDDVLIWLSGPEVRGFMVEAGRLP